MHGLLFLLSVFDTFAYGLMQGGILGSHSKLRVFMRSRRGDKILGMTDYSRQNGDLIRVFELPEGWTNCGKQDDLFQWDQMKIDPYPPQRNKNATIRVIGTLAEDIPGNAKVDYLLKYGSLPIVRDTIDACELIKDYPDLPQCPLKAGHYDVSYEDLIPMATPMGTYTVHAEGYLPQEDGSKKRIFCVEGVVSIKLFNPTTQKYVTEQDYDLDY